MRINSTDINRIQFIKILHICYLKKYTVIRNFTYTRDDYCIYFVVINDFEAKFNKCTSKIMVCQKDEFSLDTAIILDSLGNFFFF